MYIESSKIESLSTFVDLKNLYVFRVFSELSMFMEARRASQL